MEQNPQVKTTPALELLRSKGIAFTEHPFEYVEKGGTSHSSQVLGVSEHAVIKTLIFQTSESGQHHNVVVLMHGDLNVDTKKLAQALGSRRAFPCEPSKACELSGYLIGGTSPFGLKTPLPIFAEASIQDLDCIWINGGERGFLVSLTPQALKTAIPVQWINVGKTR